MAHTGPKHFVADEALRPSRISRDARPGVRLSLSPLTSSGLCLCPTLMRCDGGCSCNGRGTGAILEMWSLDAEPCAEERCILFSAAEPLPRWAPVAQCSAGTPTSTAEKWSRDVILAVDRLPRIDSEVRKGATLEKAMRPNALQAQRVCT